MLSRAPILSMVLQDIIQVIDCNWFKLSSSWGQLKVRKFLPFHPVSPHLSGSSLWGRQSLVEMLCLQAAGWRPQQSHCIYHWMSLDVIGCQWPLMVTTQKIVQNPSKSLKCCELLMPSDAQPIWHPHYFGRQAFHAGHCLSCIPTSAAMGWQNLQTFPKCVVYACSRSAWNCHNWSHFVALIDLIG